MDAEQVNLVLLTDSYKLSHHKQYPPGLSKVKAYFESRGGKHPATVFFGLQYLLKRYLSHRVTMEMVDEAEALLKPHFGRDDIFNREGWTYIVQKLGGKLPIRIRAVPEGTLVPVKNVLFTVESTDERVPWIANYVETALVQIWYPMTVASNSFAQRLVLQRHAAETGADAASVGAKLHDFGYRGCTSQEAAGIGGAAHLTVFRGSDTIAALRLIRRYYGPKDIMAATTIPATEHSTTTSWGRDGELSGLKHFLSAFPQGVLSVVADSYDVWNFIDNFVAGPELKGAVEKREGCLVIRPDSGDPKEMVLKVLSRLEEKFGSVTNSSGYKSLTPCVSAIQGDGVSYESVKAILAAMKDAGWSTDSITFGSGGALLQKVDRDTQKCAYKCCMAVIDGEQIDVYKDPVTDPGKTSKKGDITLVKTTEGFKTIRLEDMGEGMEDQLVTVFENGEVVKEYDFPEIRRRVEEAVLQA